MIYRLGDIYGAGCTKGCTECHIEQRILRTGSSGVQRLVEGRPQSTHECQRAAEIDDVSLDCTTLCESGDGLVHHCLEYACRDIALACPLIEQWLDIRFCEYTTP